MKTIFHQTPVFRMDTVRETEGRSIYLKMECFQPAGSFKIRGVSLLSQRAADAGATHLVSSSGGNAGYAVAYAGRELGIRVTVVVPATTAESVQQKIRLLGAAVVVHGSVWDEAHEYAQQLAQNTHTVYIPPFDDPVLWEGHATMIDEMAVFCQKPDAVILSVGGGGLLCGVLQGLHRNDWGDVPVIAVETEGAASYHASVQAGKLITLDAIDTVASSLGAKQVAQKALDWTKEHKIITHIVSDRSAVNACLEFADDFRVLVEPACGASLSLFYDQASIIQSYQSVLIIVCGGIGVDLKKLQGWQKDILDASS
jgi:L-serine/L-threonine ammonia-lyase